MAYQSTRKSSRAIMPEFEDENRTTVIGAPGGTVTLNCNIFMLQDFTVSWAHKTKDRGLDLLTIGNSTYTLEPRISSQFLHPSNWALRVTDLRPSDAGTYICQLSTFPTRVRMVILEIRGPMIQIIRDQVVYNAGSNLEVACVYRNRTLGDAAGDVISGIRGFSGNRNGGQSPRHRLERKNPYDVLRMIENSRLGQVPKDTIVWLHNGKRFSHHNRRRVKISRQSDHILSRLTIKSAILQDSGNYSCLLPQTNHSDTVRLVVVDGEHSAAIYKSTEEAKTNKAVAGVALNHSTWLRVLSLYVLTAANLSKVRGF